MIDDILEEDANEELLREAVACEFQKKAEAEKSWPKVTDCDRLTQVFRDLGSQGILALENAGYTMSDGFTEVNEELYERGEEGFHGYCFYHEQDLERAINGEGLMIAFGDLKDREEETVKIGQLLSKILQKAGFLVNWNGSTKQRIEITTFDWKRRYV